MFKLLFAALISVLTISSGFSNSYPFKEDTVWKSELILKVEKLILKTNQIRWVTTGTGRTQTLIQSHRAYICLKLGTYISQPLSGMTDLLKDAVNIQSQRNISPITKSNEQEMVAFDNGIVNSSWQLYWNLYTEATNLVESSCVYRTSELRDAKEQVTALEQIERVSKAATVFTESIGKIISKDYKITI